MSQTANSLLMPQHLLPPILRGRVKVGVLIGKCLLDPVPVTEEPDVKDPEPEQTARRGRPKKGEVRQPVAPRGRFGTRQCRSAEAEVAMMQSRLGDTCLPKAPFLRLAKEILQGHVDEANSGPAGEVLPNLTMSSAAAKVLQEAAEELCCSTSVKANMLAHHAHRKTVKVDDVKLVHDLASHTPGTVFSHGSASSSSMSSKRKRAEDVD